MAMRSSTVQVTTASGKAHQEMLLRTSGNMLSLLEDIQQPLLLLHKPTACSKGFTKWLRKRLSLGMIKL
jgi:P2-related tail formation protein